MGKRDEERIGEALEHLAQAIYANAEATEQLTATLRQVIVRTAMNGSVKIEERHIEDPEEVPVDM